MRPASTRRLLGPFMVIATAALGLVITVAPAPAALAAAIPPGPGPVQARSASMVTADALPTTQIDGVVWSQVIVGDSVYAGGQFANARPAGAAPGTSLMPRANLLSYNLSTGVLNTSFAPSLNAVAKIVVASPDKSRIYVGGSFTTANGQQRDRIAAYSTATGQLIASFAPNLDATVNAIAVTNTTVYIGGVFSRANGVARSRLAAFNASNGALLDWAPTADLQIDTMVMTPDGSRVIAGGRFSNVNNLPRRGLAALDPSTGALLPWGANSVITNGDSVAGIFNLSADANTIYGTGWGFGSVSDGNLEGTFAAVPNSGQVIWVEDCHGDTYGAYSDGATVYTVSHAHYCATVGGFPQTANTSINMRHSVAFTKAVTGTLGHSAYTGNTYQDWYGTPSPSIIDWFPELKEGTYTGQSQAAWGVTGNGTYVVEGGEFPTVNGVPQQGLVRFAVKPPAPGVSGPMITGSHFVPSLTSQTPGTVGISFPANWDRDDLTLTYQIIRNGDIAHPIYNGTAQSTFWNLPTISYVDTGLTPGATVQYRIFATDSDGNIVRGDTASIVVVSTPVAKFTSSMNRSDVSVDASASMASAGATLTYAWNWGDGSAAGTGKTATHHYAQVGSYTIVLTITDSRGATGTVSHSVVASTTNQPPVAAFTSTPSGLGVAFDGSGSSDSDGSVASYDWDFGDASAHGTGAKVSHTYAAAGTFSVKLTVTDDQGATGTVSHDVTVTAPTGGSIASDAFGRTVSNGWGSADEGGAWSLGGATSSYSVAGGVGRMVMAASGSGPTAVLSAVQALNANVVVDTTFDKAPTGGGYIAAVGARRVGTTSQDYRAKVTVNAAGAVSLGISKFLPAETSLKSATVAGLTVGAGDTVRIRFQVAGANPTTLQAKVWKVGTSEPSAWQVTTTDSTAGLQAAGGFRLWTYLLGNSTNAPVTASFDNFSATDPGTG